MQLVFANRHRAYTTHYCCRRWIYVSSVYILCIYLSCSGILTIIEVVILYISKLVFALACPACMVFHADNIVALYVRLGPSLYSVCPRARRFYYV